jgi:ribosomal protein S18 acetylase RimI-like enzyme
MDIHIRNAEEKDAETIQKVFYKTWIATYPNEENGISRSDLEHRFHSLLSEEKIHNVRKLIRELDSTMRFLVIEVDGQIVGVSFLEKEKDHNRFQSVYILPEYQGQGIGKKAWEYAVSFFDMTKDTVLDVVTYNKKAISFYTKLGFVDTEKRFSEYKEGMEKVAIRPMMEMRLSGKN